MDILGENSSEPNIELKPDNSEQGPAWSKPELHVLALNDALSSDGTGIDVTSGRRHVLS